MAFLKMDSKGPEVTVLQQSLKAHGFDPGAADGYFGFGTQAAVIAFQKSEKLLADGTVGPETGAALGLPLPASAAPGADVTAGVTVAAVSRMFPVTPIGNIKTHLPFILAELRAVSLADKVMVLMALGTIRAETEGFVPIDEGESRFNTSPNGHPFDLYDQRRDLGNRGAPDGANFKGRGFVQLTGRANYTTYSTSLGMAAELVDDPAKANDPTIAARLLARFLKDKEQPIRAALDGDDLATARKLVNGGTHDLDKFTEAWTTGEQVIPDA